MQDNRLPRIFLVSFALGMDKVFWYKSRSNELSTDNVECHYGLWHKDYTPKPAFYAYQTLTRICPDKSIRPKLVRYGKVYMASWRRPDKKKVWALWTSKADKTISINVKGEYTAYNHHGSKLEILPDDVRLSPSVIYIVGARSVSVE